MLIRQFHVIMTYSECTRYMNCIILFQYLLFNYVLLPGSDIGAYIEWTHIFGECELGITKMLVVLVLESGDNTELDQQQYAV